MTEKTEKKGKLLICQSYHSMWRAFELMLGDRYELVFADSSEQIISILRREPIRLLIWDIDPSHGSLERALKAISTNNFLEKPAGKECLETLRVIRQSYSELMVLLIAGEFDYDFQVKAIQQFGSVRFLTKPWVASRFIEQIEIIVGDRKGSIHKRVLRVPLALPESTKRKFSN